MKCTFQTLHHPLSFCALSHARPDRGLRRRRRPDDCNNPQPMAQQQCIRHNRHLRRRPPQFPTTLVDDAATTQRQESDDETKCDAFAVNNAFVSRPSPPAIKTATTANEEECFFGMLPSPLFSSLEERRFGYEDECIDDAAEWETSSSVETTTTMMMVLQLQLSPASSTASSAASSTASLSLALPLLLLPLLSRRLPSLPAVSSLSPSIFKSLDARRPEELAVVVAHTIERKGPMTAQKQQMMTLYGGEGNVDGVVGRELVFDNVLDDVVVERTKTEGRRGEGGRRAESDDAVWNLLRSLQFDSDGKNHLFQVHGSDDREVGCSSRSGNGGGLEGAQSRDGKTPSLPSNADMTSRLCFRPSFFECCAVDFPAKNGVKKKGTNIGGGKTSESEKSDPRRRRLMPTTALMTTTAMMRGEIRGVVEEPAAAAPQEQSRAEGSFLGGDASQQRNEVMVEEKGGGECDADDTARGGDRSCGCPSQRRSRAALMVAQEELARLLPTTDYDDEFLFFPSSLRQLTRRGVAVNRRGGFVDFLGAAAATTFCDERSGGYRSGPTSSCCFNGSHGRGSHRSRRDAAVGCVRCGRVDEASDGQREQGSYLSWREEKGKPLRLLGITRGMEETAAAAAIIKHHRHHLPGASKDVSSSNGGASSSSSSSSERNNGEKNSKGSNRKISNNKEKSSHSNTSKNQQTNSWLQTLLSHLIPYRFLFGSSDLLKMPSSSPPLSSSFSRPLSSPSLKIDWVDEGRMRRRRKCGLRRGNSSSSSISSSSSSSSSSSQKLVSLFSVTTAEAAAAQPPLSAGGGCATTDKKEKENIQSALRFFFSRPRRWQKKVAAPERRGVVLS